MPLVYEKDSRGKNMHERVDERLRERGVLLDYDTKSGTIRKNGELYSVVYRDDVSASTVDTWNRVINVQILRSGSSRPLDSVCRSLLHGLTHIDTIAVRYAGLGLLALYATYTANKMTRTETRRGFLKSAAKIFLAYWGQKISVDAVNDAVTIYKYPFGFLKISDKGW